MLAFLRNKLKYFKKNKIKTITPVKKNAYLMFTALDIPIVIRAKKKINSRGFFTGVLNLTIDNAPIIPNDRAIFPEMTFVITKVIGGNIA